MKRRNIIISPDNRRVPKEHWLAFTDFLKNHRDYYQLLAIAVFVEARLEQIRPPELQIR
jgi:hypothetical protein